jgi:PAT family beta-lactamase induction signal transducer AmpG
LLRNNPYFDRRILAVAALGFASGLPLLLTFSTLTAWLKTDGISRASIGLFALVGLPYSLKFLWAPLIDQAPFPFLSKHLGRRRGWGVGIQILLIAAIVALPIPCRIWVEWPCWPWWSHSYPPVKTSSSMPIG